MQVHRGTIGQLAVMGLMACAPARPPPAPVVPIAKESFAVLPAESEQFPLAAQATTERLRRTRVSGLEDPHLSKVSLEVVQLSIECVERTADCYASVGEELRANTLLFAEIDPGERERSVRITVTLFDVAKRSKRAAAKMFASEDDVSFGIADVVAEATKPPVASVEAARP